MNAKYFSIKEFAEIVNISEGTLRRLFREGKLKNAVKIGGRIRIIVNIKEDKPELPNLNLDELANYFETLSITYKAISNCLKNAQNNSKN